MKNFKISGLAIAFIVVAISFPRCTNLDETIYSSIMSENYYNNEQDVINAALHSFNISFNSCNNRQVVHESPSDQIGTWEREGHWWDSGKHDIFHRHEWDSNHEFIKLEWNNLFKCIGLCNSVIDDLTALDPASVKMTREGLDYWINQNRALRAWLYLRAFDAFRNIPLATTLDKDEFNPEQLPPQEMFDFIETELTECIALLPTKQGSGGNGDEGQGVWTKAGAAAVLMRLYLNAEAYVGTAMYDECAQYAQAILDGDYGTYSLGETWDEVFDWDNINCPEVIFAFPGSKAGNSYLYWGEIVRGSLPANGEDYFGAADGFNPRWGTQPSMDNGGVEYPFKLGKFVKKFQKYPSDYRLILCRNTGINEREGMFLYGELKYFNGTNTVKVRDQEDKYDLFIRDQVGRWRDVPPTEMRPDMESNMEQADHNSGWQFTKYPVYQAGSTGEWESDLVEIRLAEVIYTLAECKFQAGDIDGAGELLNSVRKRNYPEADWDAYLYAPEGNAVLDKWELYDEWGREFFAEGRRRTDLVRWGLFSTEEWWCKTPDADSHTNIFPIPHDALNANPALVQNPGYAN